MVVNSSRPAQEGVILCRKRLQTGFPVREHHHVGQKLLIMTRHCSNVLQHCHRQQLRKFCLVCRKKSLRPLDLQNALIPELQHSETFPKPEELNSALSEQVKLIIA
ncbi:MAG: hypothetical protein NVV59_01435 [Chitinophagaceae bacterium]|nr:hypothetical protein [Chitinophagaceae bacterium]